MFFNHLRETVRITKQISFFYVAVHSYRVLQLFVCSVEWIIMIQSNGRRSKCSRYPLLKRLRARENPADERFSAGKFKKTEFLQFLDLSAAYSEMKKIFHLIEIMNGSIDLLRRQSISSQILFFLAATERSE